VDYQEVFEQADWEEREVSILQQFSQQLDMLPMVADREDGKLENERGGTVKRIDKGREYSDVTVATWLWFHTEFSLLHHV